jgi:hypothetical protein
MADDNAGYPLHSAWDPGAVRSTSWIQPYARVLFRTIPYAAKFTHGRPSVKRGWVSKSLFSARNWALALFFTSV